MNKILLESMQNYLNENIPIEPSLMQVIILERMNLRLQMELYNETISIYKNTLDTLGMLAQNLEIMKNKLNYIEGSVRQKDINAGRFPA